MGTTLYELRGYMPLSLAEHTYWQPPLYFVTTAAWYRLVGFGLVQVRLVSVLFGLLAIVSWYLLGRALSGSVTLGLMVAGLVSVDYFFLVGASQGRMDIMCAALGIAAIAAYASLRQRSLKSAMFWSHVLATMAVLTHPAGLSYWLGLALLILYLDRRALSLRLVLLAFIPCLIGGLGWGAYIAQDPAAFMAQMHQVLEVNKHSFDAPGLSNISLVRNIQLELIYRYVGPFGLGPGVGLAQRIKAIVLLAYLSGIVGTFVLARTQRGILVFPLLATLTFFYLALLSPSKFSYYLPHTTMFMAACLAVFLYYLKLGPAKWVIVAAILALVGGVQMLGLLYRVRQNPYHRSFLPAAQAIIQNTKPGALILGSGELWFPLQPDRELRYDPALGYQSSRKPSIFVMDPVYHALHSRDQRTDPARYSFDQNYLDTSRLVYRDGYYEVYVR